jgi:hypothetical protein
MTFTSATSTNNNTLVVYSTNVSYEYTHYVKIMASVNGSTTVIGTAYFYVTIYNICTLTTITTKTIANGVYDIA